MKITKKKGLFNDIYYFEMVEPLTLDDFDIQNRERKPQPHSSLSDKMSDAVYANVVLLVKPHVIDMLKDMKEHGGRAAEYIMGTFKYDDYVLKGKQDPVYYASDSRRQDIKYTGIRTKERKEQKYLKVYNDFIKNFEENKKGEIIKELIGDANERISKVIGDINERYNEIHVELYVDVEYKHVWEKDWDKSPKIKSYNAAMGPINDQIEELENKLKLLKEQELDAKIEIAREDLKTDDVLSQEIKDEINARLDSKDVWKEKGRFGGFR